MIGCDWSSDVCSSDLRCGSRRLHPGVSARRGYPGTKPNLEDTWLALSLLDKIKAIKHVEDTARFIEDMQIPSLGFRNTRDSRYSNIYILHAGVLSCALLGIPVRHPTAIMDMVLSCQCADGAFAPVSVSLPNLHTHCLAIKLLKALVGSPSRAFS